MASTKRRGRRAAGNFGAALILAASFAAGSGCSGPSCEETLTCRPATGIAGNGAAAGTGSGAASGGTAGTGTAGSPATGGNATGGTENASTEAGRGGSASNTSGGDAGAESDGGAVGGTSGKPSQEANAGAAGADDHACDDVKCAHGGTCAPAGNTFKCECAPGYDGKYCEHDVNECLSVPCLHGGSCTDGVNEYVCDCDGTGYFGDNCEVAHFEFIGPPGSAADAISADGKVVVGSLDGVPARWTAETGFQKLKALSEPVDRGEAFAVNADGSVVGGYASLPSGGGAFRWTADTGVVSLHLRSDSKVVGVSEDGNAMAIGTGVAGSSGIRWTRTGGMEDIGDIGVYGEVSGISADGTIIVGSDFHDNAFRSFRWTAADGIVWLDPNCAAAAISGDGKTIIGGDYEISGVFVYTDKDGYVHLDTSDVGNPTAINYDGSVIVGQYSDVGWIWDTSHGLRWLATLLTARGTDPPHLHYVSGVSADGKVVAGAAMDQDNQSRAWVARL